MQIIVGDENDNAYKCNPDLTKGSIPFKAILHDFLKNGPTDILKMFKKDTLSCLLSPISDSGNEFGTRTFPILPEVVKLAKLKHLEGTLASGSW